MTLDADIDELTNDISAVLAKARQLNLDLCVYILSMALMEAIGAVDGRYEQDEQPRS